MYDQPYWVSFKSSATSLVIQFNAETHAHQSTKAQVFGYIAIDKNMKVSFFDLNNKAGYLNLVPTRYAIAGFL